MGILKQAYREDGRLSLLTNQGAVVSFIELYNKLTGYNGKDLFGDVLSPFIPVGKEIIDGLSNFSKLEMSLPGTISEEDLWTLFSLNVCNDFLLLPLRVSLSEYRKFFSEIGLTLYEPGRTFNPVIHEIVGVANWPSQKDGISIGTCYWPGLMFGDLLISRCAVDVYCHSSWGVVKGIADSSKLYFTNRRITRETTDKSHGWGSNSRWRTAFSRNYLVGEYALLNVDGSVDLYFDVGDPELNSLPLNAARELLLNRCFVCHETNNDDYYPYNWKMAVNFKKCWPITEANVVPFNLDKI
jgi:hypothetical protein